MIEIPIPLWLVLLTTVCVAAGIFTLVDWSISLGMLIVKLLARAVRSLK